MDAAPPIGNGRYRLLEVLGRGGMGRVYLAWDEVNQDWCACKLLTEEAALTNAAFRFRAEGEAMHKLVHPHLLPALASGEEHGQPYLVLPFAVGGTLGDRVAEQRLPAAQLCGLIQQVLAGLHHAHQHGWIHRDVKPSNVLLDAEGRALLGDFGVAREQDAAGGLTRTGVAIGTEGFMAPEQRYQARRVDPRADLYGAGATLFALLTGEAPEELHQEEARRAQLTGLPPALAEVITRATRWDPGDRYPDAAAMSEALGAAARTLPPEPFVDLARPPLPRVAPPPYAGPLRPPVQREATWLEPESRASPAAPIPVAPSAPPRRAGWAVGLTLLALTAWFVVSRLDAPRPPPAKPPWAGEWARLTREPAGRPVTSLAVDPIQGQVAWSTQRGTWVSPSQALNPTQLSPLRLDEVFLGPGGWWGQRSGVLAPLDRGELGPPLTTQAYRATFSAKGEVAWVEGSWLQIGAVRDGAAVEVQRLLLEAPVQTMTFDPSGGRLLLGRVETRGEDFVGVLTVLDRADGRTQELLAAADLVGASVQPVFVWVDPEAPWVVRSRWAGGPRAELWEVPLRREPRRKVVFPAPSVTHLAATDGGLAAVLDDSQSDLAVLGPDGRLEPLLASDANEREGVSLPDGRLVWMSDALGSWDLWIGAPDQEPALFVGGEGTQSYPTLAPGGLAWWEVSPAAAELRFQPWGGAARRILSQPVDVADRAGARPPPVSARLVCGEACVLGRSEEGQAVLRSLDLATGALGPPRSLQVPAVFTRWVVDDQAQTAWISLPEQEVIRRVDLVDGRSVDLSFPPLGRPHDLAWSPEGKLWLTTFLDDHWCLLELDPEGGRAERVATLDRRVGQPFLGPAGQLIVTLIGDDNDVWTLR